MVSWRALELSFAHLTRIYGKTDGMLIFLLLARSLTLVSPVSCPPAALCLTKYFMQGVVSAWADVYDTALAINQPFKLFEREKLNILSEPSPLIEMAAHYAAQIFTRHLTASSADSKQPTKTEREVWLSHIESWRTSFCTRLIAALDRYHALHYPPTASAAATTASASVATAPSEAGDALPGVLLHGDGFATFFALAVGTASLLRVPAPLSAQNKQLVATGTHSMSLHVSLSMDPSAHSSLCLLFFFSPRAGAGTALLRLSTHQTSGHQRRCSGARSTSTAVPSVVRTGVGRCAGGVHRPVGCVQTLFGTLLARIVP